MNANVTKTNKGAILAAIMALVMVFAGVAVITSDNSVDAAWEMGGDIPAGNQNVAPGVEAVAISNFTITDGAIWTVQSGASFIINEGVTVTIEKGAVLNIENGAYVEVNGTLDIKEGSSLNNATVKSSMSGFYVNGTLNVNKGAISADVTSIEQKYSGLTETGLTFKKATSADTTTGDVYSNIEVLDNNNGIATITGTVPQHLNGAGTMGYWVGAKVSGLAEGTYSLDWTGSAKSIEVAEDGTATFYIQAGQTCVITMTNSANSYKFVLDASGVNSDSPEGEIYVNGAMSVDSSSKVYTNIADQTIYVADGAKAALNATFDNVAVSAYAGSTKNPYTYGSVNLSTTSGKAPSDLTFTVSSERISAYVYDWTTQTGEKSSRVTDFKLDVAGDVAYGTEIKTMQTLGIAGAYKQLYYLNEKEDGSNGFLMYGTVTINGTLNIDGSLVGQPNSTLAVNGTLNIDGDKADAKDSGQALIRFLGHLDISGTVAIDSVATDGTVTSPSGDGFFNGAYINIIGTGKMTVTDGDFSFLDNAAGINGAAYETSDDDLIVTDLATAVAAQVADINVYGYTITSGEYKLEKPYVVSADITIPSGTDLAIEGTLLVSEGVTLTIAEGAGVDSISGSTGLISVDGTLMDYEMIDFVYGEEPATEVPVKAEVMATDEDTYNMYTSLETALAGTPGTIVLFGNVDIEGTVTIPSGFTVQQNGRQINIKNDSTLIVEGIIDSGNAAINLVAKETDPEDSEKITAKAGVLTVNNMIVNPNIVYGDGAATVPGFTANGTIGDYEDALFLLAPAIAAENAGTLYEIASQGKLSYNGTLTFTASENNNGDVITIGGTEVTITGIVVSGFGVDITATEFTGSVQASVTAGDSAVEFTKATGYQIAVTESTVDDVDITTLMLTAGQSAAGNITVSSGSVTLANSASFGKDKDSTLTIANGATLVVPEDVTLTIVQGIANGAADKDKFTALTVDGTLDIQEKAGFTFSGSNYNVSIVEINGTMNVASDITFDDDVYVDGSINVADTGSITLNGDMYVNGTINGAVDIASDNEFIIAYPNAIMDGAELNITDGVSGASATALYINGEIYMTVYGLKGASVIEALGNETYNIQGYEPVTADTIVYTDADYQNKLTDGAVMEDTPAAYIKLKALNAKVQISIGSGLSVFIDGVKMGSTGTEYVSGPQTSVGEHTIEVTINPGLSGDYTITFNGQTVTDGKIVITSQMATDAADPVVLSVTGNLTQDATVIDSGNSDDGMGLTDYLLIILVVLIVIMAIMVAMRLMRS